ncbi:MAG: chromosomal replication initiator protein [Patescibacteria group bacterium]|nr:chromosomal replication initiator protein [Patescibacteria group bacterium]
MVDNKQLWEQALSQIELSTSKANFGTWFKNTYIHKNEEGIIYLSAPNTFVKDWLRNKYHKFILKALRDISPEVRNLEYIIIRKDDKTTTTEDSSQKNLTTTTDLGLNDLYINKDSNLNPKYTFDNFVVGPFNEIAYAAAQAVTKNPGMNYNPLYIYGVTGLGKTHLLQAVGNYIKKQNPNKRVFYTTSETFTVDCVNSILNNKINLFKEKYRKYDLIIIDDIQFFSNKEKTQEELFHLFNHFYENNKQIIFSSDQPPKYIEHLEDRLRSRFEGGMIVDVSKPDYESRLAILKTKSRVLEKQIPDEILEYIASIVCDSIRELEGTLKSVIVQTQAKKRDITLTEIKNILKNNIKPKKAVSFKDVVKIISEYYTIEEKSLYEKTRRKEVVKPRQIIMYIMREDFNSSYPYIGQKLGGRDHTTVIHAYEKIKRDIQKDTVLNQEIEQIRSQLYNS